MYSTMDVIVMTSNKARTNCTRSIRKLLTISFHVILGCLAHFHAEHDNLWGHGGHLVAETILVDTVHVCRKRVLAARLALTGINHSIVGSSDL